MTPQPPVSIVIPAWHRDDPQLRQALQRLGAPGRAQVIVSLPREERRLIEQWSAMYPHARFVDAPRGRASQMNAGAAVATGKWLLFLHADTRLAQDWESVIERANRATGVVGGSFRFALDSGDWRARLIEFGVRLRVALFGLPYGDQALFARRDVFDAMGGDRKSVV